MSGDSASSADSTDGTDTTGSTDDSAWLKWVGFGVLPVEAYLGVLLLAVRRYSLTMFDSVVLSILNCFAGGVFVALGLEHIVPDAIGAQGDAYDGQYPLAMLFVVVAFYLLFFFQRILPRTVAALGGLEVSSRSCCNTSIVQPNECERTCQCGLPYPSDMEAASDPKAVKNVKNVDPVVEEPVSRVQRVARLLAPWTLMSAMVFHAALEGLALGIATDFSDAISLFIGLVAHKWVEGIALTTRFVKAGADWKTIVVSMFPFAFIAPVFIVVGMHVGSDANPWAQMILNAIVAGVFLYIGAFEIVMDEFSQAAVSRRGHIWWWTPLLFAGTMVGVGAISAIMIVDH